MRTCKVVVMTISLMFKLSHATPGPAEPTDDAAARKLRTPEYDAFVRAVRLLAGEAVPMNRCSDGMKACFDACCDPREPCCSGPDNTHFCGPVDGRCPQ